MHDVFISYAREDRDRARVLAHALEAQGWSVWWDRKILAGQTFDQTIEHQLTTARSVIVLWSTYSVDSEWVRNEAAVAAERDTLVPALIDNVKQPLEFRRRHAADLTLWRGDAEDDEFRGLCDGIAAKTRTSAEHRTLPPVVRESRAPIHRRPALAVVAGVIGVMFTLWLGLRDGGVPVNGGPPVAQVSPTETSRDRPVPLALDTVRVIRLAPNQEYYLQLSERVEDVKIVIDMRHTDNRSSNLQSQLAVLDENGAIVEERVVVFNEIDVGARKTAAWTTPRPQRLGFRLLNGNAPADFWLGVRRMPAEEFVPLFGGIVPKSLSLGHDVSGMLDVNEDAYYMASLAEGDYDVTVDFATADRIKTNIQGSVALLDRDGGNYLEIVRFNEIDVSSRKADGFLLSNAGPVVFNVQNTHGRVRYTLSVNAAAANQRTERPAASNRRSLSGAWTADAVRAAQRPFRIGFDLEAIDARLFGTVHYPSGDAGILDGEIDGDRIRFRTVHTPQFDSAPAEIRWDGRIVGETLDLMLQDSNGTARVTARRTGG